jgi:hypothetical protein
MSPMDWSTILIIVVIAAIAYYFFSRNRAVPRGTYNDPDVSSSGSIGGGPSAHDDRELHSSGSIGGGARAYDQDEHESRGSIGGSPETRRGEHRTVADPTKGDYTHADRDQHDEYDRVQDRRARVQDDDDVRSSGSIGGASQ